jgi:hypothetical protein
MEIQCPTAERLLNEDLEIKAWVRLGDKDINNVFRRFFRLQRIFEVVEGNRDLPSSTSSAYRERKFVLMVLGAGSSQGEFPSARGAVYSNSPR